MSRRKQKIRAAFRDACFTRDGYRCICCGVCAPKDDADMILDAHHITNRDSFVNGGYVRENGATLCKTGNNCHLKAEKWLQDGQGEDGFDPTTLYRKIGSSQDQAVNADIRQ